MKLVLNIILLLCLIVGVAHAGFEGKNGGTSLKIFNKINCDAGLTCSRAANGVFEIDVDGTGFDQAQVAATATTITSAQCGSTFYNSGAVEIQLPEASANLGCRLTFITADASNFDINPTDPNQILVETDATGDAIRNATLGNSIMLEAITPDSWAPVSTIGTWADIN